MHVERTHHIDASEPDAQGFYEYYYEYDVYRFRDGPATLSARSYTDTPERASFLGLETRPDRPPRLLGPSDLTLPLFVAACGYLRDQGKTDLQWLSGRGTGYEAVPAFG